MRLRDWPGMPAADVSSIYGELAEYGDEEEAAAVWRDGEHYEVLIATRRRLHHWGDLRVPYSPRRFAAWHALVPWSQVRRLRGTLTYVPSGTQRDPVFYLESDVPSFSTSGRGPLVGALNDFLTVVGQHVGSRISLAIEGPVQQPVSPEPVVDPAARA